MAEAEIDMSRNKPNNNILLALQKSNGFDELSVSLRLVAKEFKPYFDKKELLLYGM